MRAKVQDNARKDFAPDTQVTPEMLDLAELASQWSEAVKAAAKEAAVKAQEKLLDYTAGPEELLKQFSSKQGGAVEIGIKKGEIWQPQLTSDGKPQTIPTS